MYRDFIKPLGDFVGALLLSILIAPILLIVCIWVALESPGSPIFVQTRVGKNLKNFSLFKIRSMKRGSDKAGPYFTAENDSRITRAGRFIRATSIDELPQIWNVLLGQMSFIGPRPDVPAQEPIYDGVPGSWKERHQVKPGITGLAQARFRSSASFEQRLASDLEYGKNVRFALDMRILILTARILLKRKNVN